MHFQKRIESTVIHTHIFKNLSTDEDSYVEHPAAVRTEGAHGHAWLW